MSSTSTGLHSRRKSGLYDPENPDSRSSPIHGSPSRIRKRSGLNPLPFFRSEVRCALKAVASFLVVGLFIGYFVLHHQHRKVVMHILKNPMAHAGAALKGRVGFRHHFYSGHPRSVTIVMPSVVNPKNRARRLDSILETWGPSARAVYVVHNVSEFPKAAHAVLSENSKPHDPFSYPQLLLLPPEIGIEDGVPRLNYVIRSVYDNINPDFAFFVNDHTYVIPEHLCKYLEHKHPSQDMYHGHAMKNGNSLIFNSGAAGYVLSRETMKGLVKKWDEEDETCLVKNGAKWLQGNPGLVTTQCLKEKLNVLAVDTRHHGKWHRFHAFPLTRMVTGDVDQWYRNKHVGMDELMKTDESYNTLLAGADCCAQDTISFHYVEFKESRALFATREALLKNPHMTDHELKSLMLAEWPKERSEIGWYSKGLPQETDELGWEQLLQVTRKISSRHTQREC